MVGARVGVSTRALVVEDEAAPVAIAVAAVRSVVAAPSLAPLPTAPPLVLGLANVRGDVVPVLDTGLLLGLEPLGKAPFVLVVDTKAGPAGLAVLRMPRTEWVADGRLFDPDQAVVR